MIDEKYLIVREALSLNQEMQYQIGGLLPAVGVRLVESAITERRFTYENHRLVKSLLTSNPAMRTEEQRQKIEAEKQAILQNIGRCPLLKIVRKGVLASRIF